MSGRCGCVCVCLYVCLSVSRSVCLSMSVGNVADAAAGSCSRLCHSDGRFSQCLCVSVCLSVCLYVCLSVSVGNVADATAGSCSRLCHSDGRFSQCSRVCHCCLPAHWSRHCVCIHCVSIRYDVSLHPFVCIFGASPILFKLVAWQRG